MRTHHPLTQIHEGPVRVKSSRSISQKYYHLSGWYWGIPDTRHSEYPGIRVAAFGHKQPLAACEFGLNLTVRVYTQTGLSEVRKDVFL